MIIIPRREEHIDERKHTLRSDCLGSPLCLSGSVQETFVQLHGILIPYLHRASLSTQQSIRLLARD